MRSLSSSRRVQIDYGGTALSHAPLGKVEAGSMHARQCWSDWARTASRFDLVSVASHSD